MAKIPQLVQECKREHENCLYTSTALYELQKSVRLWRRVFVIVPLILGGLAGWTLLADASFPGATGLQSTFALLAGLLPTVYTALKLDESESVIEANASEFKNLQDRFRQAALIGSQKSFADFEAEFRELMDRMEQARCRGVVIPDRFFKRGQAKVQGGQYDFDVDLGEDARTPPTGPEA